MLSVYKIEKFSKEFETKTPQEIIEWAVGVYWPEIAMSSSFQTQSVPLLHMVIQIKHDLPVFFIDCKTEKLPIIPGIKRTLGEKVTNMFTNTDCKYGLYNQYLVWLVGNDWRMIDMNGDGIKDVITTKGWWQCPADPTYSNWGFHTTDFGEDCSQIYALATPSNGLPDLISASAHHYGIWWHERTADEKGNTNWKHHIIFNKFSQSHALAMSDINGDGHPDLITGKRYFAHNEKDPGAFEPSVLYWFEYKPGDSPSWIPHLIDEDSGVGLQVVVKDINNDGLPDIIVANKKGVFFFEQLPQ